MAGPFAAPSTDDRSNTFAAQQTSPPPLSDHSPDPAIDESGPRDPLAALRAAFPSKMATSALGQLRISRIDDSEVELTGPSGAIGVFRARIDDVSRALSGALGRRVRAILTPESSLSASDPESEHASDSSLTMESAKEHPLVAAARRAFNAEVQRVEPIPNRPNAPEPTA